jgi:isopenicillin-N epimerase
VFLNHGSFGACPIPVFEEYQRWQRELEWQPVEFLGRRADSLLDHARSVIAEYLNADADNLAFVTNSTTGVNVVARSLALSPGDEILATNHEYGACDKTWELACRKTGARYIHHQIPLPVTTPEAFVESFWSAVTPRTKVVYLSHITSPTALIFPVAEICRRAREAGIISLVDGAHAPGQVPVDLKTIDADFYTGNFHKWLCAPKGSGFLFTRPEHHPLIEPTVVSWGYAPDASYVSRLQGQGTRDLAAYLVTPAAIEFQRAHNWDTVRAECHTLTLEARRRLADLTGQEPIAPEGMGWSGQMVTLPVPPCDVSVLKTRLYDEFCIEIPTMEWGGKPYIRASFQGYNTVEDLDRLIEALKVILSL